MKIDINAIRTVDAVVLCLYPRGQVYFILDGSGTDITSYCTESTYYEYEQIADNGYRHVVIVGGLPDDLGWGEFVWDENGNAVGSNATFLPDINERRPEWLKLAEAALRPDLNWE